MRSYLLAVLPVLAVSAARAEPPLAVQAAPKAVDLAELPDGFAEEVIPRGHGVCQTF